MTATVPVTGIKCSADNTMVYSADLSPVVVGKGVTDIGVIVPVLGVKEVANV